MSRTPLILDLFCCQGGAAAGYARAGFEVLGVDRDPQPNYPFSFVQADALEFLAEMIATRHIAQFDAVHTSPPCQFHSVMTNAAAKTRHVDLIPPTRELLAQTNLPTVIENVEGARKALVDPVRLCGSSFGLGVRRHRFFELNGFTMDQPACRHREQGPVLGVYGNPEVKDYSKRPDGTNRGRKANSPKQASDALGGVEWMTWQGMTQCLPPAYTEHIGRAILDRATTAPRRTTAPDCAATG